VERSSLGKEVLGDPSVSLRLGADALNVVVVDAQLAVGSDFVDRSKL
jgi:hypothetical protein